jgi:template-activating factor I
MATNLLSEVENGGINEEIVEEMKGVNQEIEVVETEIAKQHIKALKPIYEKRKEILKKIPKFWSQVFMKRAYIGQYLSTDDYSVVQFIDDVTVEMDENSLESFKIVMNFSENEYFKNKELIKEFIVEADGQRKIKSTPIEWFDGRDYTKKRKANDDEDDQSFIKWFSEEISDENSWEIGKLIKDEVYPQAWLIYTNDDDDDDDDIIAGDDEEINADFDEESEEEELEVPSKKRVKHN